MSVLQTVVNGLLLGGLYACMAAGFSLVWGVMNVLNMLHGSLIVLGGYLIFFAWRDYGVDPFIALPFVCLALFALGYLVQFSVINKIVGESVLTTLTLTFGLNLILYNLMVVYYSATPVRVTLNLGVAKLGGLFMPVDRLLGMILALLLTGLLYLVLRKSRIGRAIVAVRMNASAAALMGIRVNRIYAVTFGIGALMAGAAGAIFAMIYPIATNVAETLLGKSFIICIIGGLGSVQGALVGGLALGLVENFAVQTIGPQNAPTLGFVLMLILLLVRPNGLAGVKGFE